MTLHVNGQKTQNISLEGVGTPTYKNLQKFLDAYGSAGIFEGGTITDSGAGEVDIAACAGVIRTTDSETGKLVSFDVAATTDVSLTDNSMNYIYVDYNSGAPVYAVTTNYDSVNLHSEVIVGRVYRMGTTLYISNIGQDIQDNVLRDLYRIQYIRRMEWGSGSTLSFTTATRQPTVTAGVFFSNYDKVETAAFDASGTDRFTAWYRNGSGGWTAVTLQQNVDNLNYDNGSGTLTALNGGDYGVHWVYELVDGTIHIQYGQANYTTLSNARNSTVPSSQPTPIVGLGILIGRLIILKSATTIYEVSSAFSTVFTGTATTSHNDLANIQGGTSGEYYHLTSAEETAVGTIGDKADKTQKLDDFGTPDDNTDLNANTTNHGLLLKAVAPAAGIVSVPGIANGETAYSLKPVLPNAGAANGKVYIGKADGTFALVNLTQGANVTITNADGAVTIASTGGGDFLVQQIFS